MAEAAPGVMDDRNSLSDGSTPVTSQQSIKKSIEEGTTEQKLWTGVKQNPRLAICGVLLAASALLYGYEVVFVGAVAALPAFK